MSGNNNMIGERIRRRRRELGNFRFVGTQVHARSRTIVGFEVTEVGLPRIIGKGAP